MLSKILIANRGEIALRIARTCRELGIRTVAVYAESDAGRVVEYADQAICIGPAAARHSYLYAAAVTEAALLTGADAVHPGYGFLSEDPDFAEICQENDLVFIGPPTDVLRRLGDKATAREAATRAGLPVLPGTETVPNPRAAERLGDDIGFPLIVKAVAGGGGRGITVVRDRAALRDAYASTRATALALFGDGRVYLERFLDGARHVEAQILADAHGTVVQFGLRDCSVQRRHQKLVEETPAPALPAGLTSRIADGAANAARAAGYVGAGTYEFLVDSHGHHYFMEVNCRLQVEHPVTEMATGIDLVREQLLIAGGEKLAIPPPGIAPRGAAIECRVNAEDPKRGFAPAPGTIDEFEIPHGHFTRVDTHLRRGMTVTADYDPLLAKVVVWAPERDQAIARMDLALSEFRVSGHGMATSIDFLREVLRSHPFRTGSHTTGLVGELAP